MSSLLVWTNAFSRCLVQADVLSWMRSVAATVLPIVVIPPTSSSTVSRYHLKQPNHFHRPIVHYYAARQRNFTMAVLDLSRYFVYLSNRVARLPFCRMCRTVILFFYTSTIKETPSSTNTTTYHLLHIRCRFIPFWYWTYGVAR